MENTRLNIETEFYFELRIVRRKGIQEVVMKKIKVLSLFVSFCLLIMLFPTTSVADTKYSNVTGTISLPGNEKAPSGGVKVKLLIGTDNLTPSNKKDDVEIEHEITIPKGKNSHTFSVKVPKSDNKNATYTVFYTVGNDYAPFGWYSKDRTTAIKEERTKINVNKGDVKGIDIEILAGKSISGKLTLGNNKTTLPKDMKFTITAIQKGSNNNSADDDIIISKDVTIPKGKDDVSYQLLVPQNSSGKGYMVYYAYQNDVYRETGYYHTSGTSRTESKVTLIDVSNTVTGINLITNPFAIISGKLLLPDGEKAPAAGVEAIITALNKGSSSSINDDFSFMETVQIKKGANSVDYSMVVPVTSTDYLVSYTVSKSTGYQAEGFYSKDGTVTSSKKATMVKPVDNKITGINLSILKKDPAKPTPTPTPIPNDAKYDLNGDGYVNVFDLLDLAKVIVNKYEHEGFDKDLEQYEKHDMDYQDLKVLWDVFKPFTNNKYKTKWFNNVKGWFNCGWDYNWKDWKDYDWKDFNWEDFDWKDYDWKDWKDFDWKNWPGFNWKDSYSEEFSWDDWEGYWKDFPYGDFHWGEFDGDSWENFDWQKWSDYWDKFDWSKVKDENGWGKDNWNWEGFDWNQWYNWNGEGNNKNGNGNKFGWFNNGKMKKND